MYKLTGGNTLVDVNLIMQKADIREGAKVADLGCGTTGYFVFAAARLAGKLGKIYAVDIQKIIIENLTRRLKRDNIENVSTVWADLEVFGSTAIESGTLDAVLLINTLYQSRKHPAIMREAVRLLRPSGRMLIVEWKNLSLPFGPPPSERVSRENLVQAAPKLGLDLVDEFQAGPCHYGLVFIKV